MPLIAGTGRRGQITCGRLGEIQRVEVADCGRHCRKCLAGERRFRDAIGAIER